MFILWILYVNFAVSSVIALGANYICNKIPGLSPRQRTICQGRPDAIAAVGRGGARGLGECRYQFRNERWNCTYPQQEGALYDFRLAHYYGTREAAFTYAIYAVGVAYAVTEACAHGNLTSCGCDKSKIDNRLGAISSGAWKWGGCSADIRYGLKFARIFVDARELSGDSRSLMNLHNNRAGRKTLKDNMSTQCKCHGTSGSCSMKTCWNKLPKFRALGDILAKRYKKARYVQPIKSRRSRNAVFLKLKKSGRPDKKPRRIDLVYLNHSPNYCDYNDRYATYGTKGRMCNMTDPGVMGCTQLCCGRGQYTIQTVKTWQCHCKFHWCCTVTCKTCNQEVEIHTCK